MDATKKQGLWLLLTHDRVTTNLPRFFAAAKATGMSTPGAVVVDEADYAKNNEAYDALELPDNWTVHVVPGGCCGTATEQALHDLCDDLDYVGWLADDLIPETPGWDVKCIEALTGWNVVSTNDGKWAPNKLNGATVWSGDLVRAAGYLYAPGLRHFYIDTLWEELGKLMNCWTVLMDVMVRHAHVSYGDDTPDKTTERTHTAWATDEEAFLNWKNNGRLDAANRIGELLVEYGVSEALPSLAGLRVMIATPCGSGRYERLFMQSLHGTVELLRQCGAQVNFAELPYCSDIALARNKIAGMFLRSGATHLLSIDDDMGWKPQDVARLFSYKRDFVAVAGPRKVFPPSFAVQNTSASGHAMPLRQESVTGLFEASHIGMAFALVTREAFERVVNANSDLAFHGNDGSVEHGIFNPMVVNRRYMSEDFAFCERYRAVGGKIYVDPHISLQHVGTFVWQGDWYSHLVSETNERAAA